MTIEYYGKKYKLPVGKWERELQCAIIYELGQALKAAAAAKASRKEWEKARDAAIKKAYNETILKKVEESGKKS